VIWMERCWLKVGTNAHIKFFFVFFRPFFRGGPKKGGRRGQASKEDKPIKAEKKREETKSRTRHLNLRTRLDHDAKFIDILRRYNRVN
jgi:hypothetical protein